MGQVGLQGFELGVLVGQLKPADWLACTGEPTGCLAAARRVSAHNTSLLPSLCGEVGLVSQTPLPWAWSGAADRTVMSSTVARMEVSC